MAKLVEAGDELLVERALDGDTRAFETLMRRYALLMRSYASRLLGSRSDAEDVIQETLLAAWTTLDRLEEPAKVKSWLLRIVSHKSMDQLRRKKPHANIDDVEPALPETQNPERLAVTASQMSALSKALDRLPTTQRQCWVLREIGELSYEEIAEHLEVNASTVRGQLARARTRLIKEMEGWR